MEKIFTTLGVSPNPMNPIITLSGSANMSVALGSTFVDPGATCTDDVDRNCTVISTGSVNTTLSGSYTLTYSAIDSSGNLALPLVRTIRVSDLTPPVITLIGSGIINLVIGVGVALPNC
jgi:protein involved in polysaccharide export with SLBB domain